jgi:hypothetical protein
LPPSSQSANVSEVGFVIGGGLDFKVMPRWSLGADGLFYMFAKTTKIACRPLPAPPSSSTTTLR